LCYLFAICVIIKNKPRVSPCVILNPIRMIIRIATFVLHYVMCHHLSVIHYAMPFPLCYMLCCIHKEISPIMLISLLRYYSLCSIPPGNITLYYICLLQCHTLHHASQGILTCYAFSSFKILSIMLFTLLLYYLLYHPHSYRVIHYAITTSCRVTSYAPHPSKISQCVMFYPISVTQCYIPP